MDQLLEKEQLKPILLNANTEEQAKFKQTVISTANHLQKQIDCYRRGILEVEANPSPLLLELNKSDLTGFPRSSDAIAGGCSTCQSKGIPAYPTSGQYFQERLLDSATEQASIGGVRMSREKLKNIMELPSQQTIEEFEKLSRFWQKDRPELDFIEVENGKVFILEDELDAYCKNLEVWITDQKDLYLIQQLQQLLEMHKSVNELLKEKGWNRIGLTNNNTWGKTDNEKSEGAFITRLPTGGYGLSRSALAKKFSND